MNDYRYAYENYYRNLNKDSKIIENKRTDLKGLRRIKRKSNSNEKNIQKIFVRQLCGAFAVVSCFTLLKYIPLTGTQYIYKKSKEIINNNATYDGAIEAVKSINIGEYSMAAANINGVTLDDLKEKPLKEKLMKYYKDIKEQSYYKEKQL